MFKNNYLTQIFLSCDLGCSAVLLDADDDDIIWMLMFSYIFQLLIKLNSEFSWKNYLTFLFLVFHFPKFPIFLDSHHFLYFSFIRENKIQFLSQFKPNHQDSPSFCSLQYNRLVWCGWGFFHVKPSSVDIRTQLNILWNVMGLWCEWVYG